MSNVVDWGLLQFLEQRLGILQVGGVEAFGEPAVDGLEERAGLVALALVAEPPILYGLAILSKVVDRRLRELL